MKYSSKVANWLFGILVFTIGVLNIIWIDIRPGIIYIILSALYFIPAELITKNKTSLKILKVFKIIFAILILWFTLGISDLGDMID